MMKKVSNEKGFAIREASETDIPLLAVHHRLMFKEIWEKRGLPFEDTLADEVEQAYSRKLSEEFQTGSCKSWLIEREGRSVASGAITIVNMVPTPNDLSTKVAYLHSMYTETEHRGKNLAGRIVKTALEYCKAKHIKRIFLNASEAGRPIYERIGFTSAPEMMRFFVE